MTIEEIRKNAPDGATSYMIQRGDIVYVKPHKEYGWYRWAENSWQHYCWYQEVKPL